MFAKLIVFFPFFKIIFSSINCFNCLILGSNNKQCIKTHPLYKPHTHTHSMIRTQKYTGRKKILKHNIAEGLFSAQCHHVFFFFQKKPQKTKTSQTQSTHVLYDEQQRLNCARIFQLQWILLMHFIFLGLLAIIQDWYMLPVMYSSEHLCKSYRNICSIFWVTVLIRIDRLQTLLPLPLFVLSDSLCPPSSLCC